ncbi:uncharacterized protein I303_107493 [Kwoniella dejecticola CBS 10117]|uniref:BRCT domain-containing protein n=1 Tax=Kwoniella dejecticola CBS 10117 TaxID=1296121 RepID=A0A1A5ZZW3_9TREE|nr:uncharacterized protein I303_06898 [Kwoniella dejecticola CBS 10117]OBR83333.1 hypothetical protein I303_06898 [Kwoniella dejecticola CBS 10117]
MDSNNLFSGLRFSIPISFDDAEEDEIKSDGEYEKEIDFNVALIKAHGGRFVGPPSANDDVDIILIHPRLYKNAIAKHGQVTVLIDANDMTIDTNWDEYDNGFKPWTFLKIAECFGSETNDEGRESGKPVLLQMRWVTECISVLGLIDEDYRPIPWGGMRIKAQCVVKIDDSDEEEEIEQVHQPHQAMSILKGDLDASFNPHCTEPARAKCKLPTHLTEEDPANSPLLGIDEDQEEPNEIEIVLDTPHPVEHHAGTQKQAATPSIDDDFEYPGRHVDTVRSIKIYLHDDALYLSHLATALGLQLAGLNEADLIVFNRICHDVYNLQPSNPTESRIMINKPSKQIAVSSKWLMESAKAGKRLAIDSWVIAPPIQSSVPPFDRSNASTCGMIHSSSHVSPSSIPRRLLKGARQKYSSLGRPIRPVIKFDNSTRKFRIRERSRRAIGANLGTWEEQRRSKIMHIAELLLKKPKNQKTLSYLRRCPAWGGVDNWQCSYTGLNAKGEVNEMLNKLRTHRS